MWNQSNQPRQQRQPGGPRQPGQPGGRPQQEVEGRQQTQQTPPPAAQPGVVRKAFRAYTFQDAMNVAREKMGPDAVIVSSRQLPSRRNPNILVVEVIAEVATKQSAPISDPAQGSSSIGGLGEQLVKIREIVVMPFRYPDMFNRLGVPPPKGVLMYGPPGTGKTLIARTLAEECGANFLTVNGPELMGGTMGESEKNLRELFEKAKEEAPTLIFFDEIDAIAGKRESAGSGAERRIVTQLLTLMDGMDTDAKVLVLAATNRPDSIDTALRRPGRFDREVEIPIPNEKSRYEIFKVHCQKMALGPDVKIKKIASETHGYVGADIAQLCKEAGMRAIRESMPSGGEPPPNLQVFQRHFDAAFKDFKPSTMREGSSGAETSKVTWDDVGGLEQVKRDLQEAIILPLKRPELFERMKIRPSKGVLLAGPPGTGKTLIAKAAAGECGVNFIAVNGPSLVTKYVGDSEKAIRDIFERARNASPCIIFFDEFDSIAPVRGGDAGDSSQFADRMVAQLLVEMDGFSDEHRIFCLAATNRPEAIDPAVRRPGRFDKVIQIPLPDAESRRRIINVHLKGKPLEKDVDAEALTAMTDGLSGAEIEEFCRRAAMEAIRNLTSDQGRLEPTISHRDLVEALGEVFTSKGLSPPKPPPPRILVLDDNAIALELAVESLKTGDYDPVPFDDPEEALMAIKDGSFEMAILDIEMPKMNGLEVLAHIRKILPNLPVIMATGKKDSSTAFQSFKLGALDYLNKPVTVNDLLASVKKALSPAEG